MEPFNLIDQLSSSSGRTHLSFASKFAHFFIDMERFPIYDSYAKKMVAYHLGKDGQVIDQGSPYKSFLENLEILKERAHLSCSNKELDRYLWLAGLYRTWNKQPNDEENNKSKEKIKKNERINVEVKKLFIYLSSIHSPELALLLPDAR